eukprot:Rhum_TRINITY_DN16777_c0_g1::Rhum_TRINITY_DN16777_c0_g1_i1::g.164355::m.164355
MPALRLCAVLCAACLLSLPSPSTAQQPPPIIVPCKGTVYAHTCTRGAKVSPAGICECFEAGFACDTASGLCRKLKVNIKSDTSTNPTGVELVGFALLILVVLFLLANIVFYIRMGRLPFWVKNFFCTCLPRFDCNDRSSKKKKPKEERQNPMETLGMGPANRGMAGVPGTLGI